MCRFRQISVQKTFSYSFTLTAISRSLSSHCIHRQAGSYVSRMYHSNQYAFACYLSSQRVEETLKCVLRSAVYKRKNNRNTIEYSVAHYIKLGGAITRYSWTQAYGQLVLRGPGPSPIKRLKTFQTNAGRANKPNVKNSHSSHLKIKRHHEFCNRRFPQWTRKLTQVLGNVSLKAHYSNSAININNFQGSGTTSAGNEVEIHQSVKLADSLHWLTVASWTRLAPHVHQMNMRQQNT